MRRGGSASRAMRRSPIPVHRFARGPARRSAPATPTPESYTDTCASDGHVKNALRALETKISLITIAVFVIGGADLLRGGITVSAIALTLGYCVLLPLWIYRAPLRDKGARTAVPDGTPPPEWLAASIVAAIVFLL